MMLYNYRIGDFKIFRTYLHFYHDTLFEICCFSEADVANAIQYKYGKPEFTEAKGRINVADIIFGPDAQTMEQYNDTHNDARKWYGDNITLEVLSEKTDPNQVMIKVFDQSKYIAFNQALLNNIKQKYQAEQKKKQDSHKKSTSCTFYTRFPHMHTFIRFCITKSFCIITPQNLLIHE